MACMAIRPSGPGSRACVRVWPRQQPPQGVKPVEALDRDATRGSWATAGANGGAARGLCDGTETGVMGRREQTVRRPGEAGPREGKRS